MEEREERSEIEREPEEPEDEAERDAESPSPWAKFSSGRDPDD